MATLSEINELSFGEFLKRYGGDGLIQAVFVYLLVKLLCNNIGRLFLLALIVAAVIWVWQL